MQVSEVIVEGVAWKRSGSKITRKYRCTSGPRKGRVMSSAAACNAPYKIKNAIRLKQTKSKMGTHRVVRSNRTKAHDPTSRRLKQLNRTRNR